MRNVHKSFARLLKSKTAIHAIVTASVAFTATACSVAVTDQKKGQTDASQNLDDSDALVITTKPDAVARVRIPEELLVNAMRHGKNIENQNTENQNSQNQGSASAQPDAPADTTGLDKIPAAPGIAIVCAQPRDKRDEGQKDRRDATVERGDGMRRIQHMEQLLQGITLRAAVREKTAEGSGEQTIAGITQAIKCRDFAIVMQHLPPGKNLTLRVALSNDSMAFTGVSGEFKHEGVDFTAVKLRLAKREGVAGADAGSEARSIIDEIFGDQKIAATRPDVMPVGLVLFKDAAAKEVHDIVGDFAARLVCDTKTGTCRTESKQIDAEKSARLIELMKSNSMRILATGAQARLMAIHQLRCTDEQCTGFPLTLR